jgi:hypothetical protein
MGLNLSDLMILSNLEGKKKKEWSFLSEMDKFERWQKKKKKEKEGKEPSLVKVLQFSLLLLLTMQITGPLYIVTTAWMQHLAKISLP